MAFCDCLAGWSLDARTGSCHRDRLPCPGPEEGVWLGGSCHAHPCGPGMTLWGEEGEGEGACLPLDSGPAFTTCTQERAGVLTEEVSLGSVLRIVIVIVMFEPFSHFHFGFHRFTVRSKLWDVCRLV